MSPLTAGGDVEPLRLLAELVHGLHGLVVELDLLEVLADARRRDRLGDDAVAAELRPGQHDLGARDRLARGLGKALGDGLRLGHADQQRQAEAVVAEGRVGGDVDALLRGVLDELGLGVARVALDLVDSGDDARLLDQVLELCCGSR